MANNFELDETKKNNENAIKKVELDIKKQKMANDFELSLKAKDMDNKKEDHDFDLKNDELIIKREANPNQFKLRRKIKKDIEKAKINSEK